ncbi:luciferase [Candidatus Methylacidiphilum fumarolicum]|uniref:Luciferase-like, subgroup n=3 Tax=Candidatus Methylacidiphilum fumarolicum TaxID=591154 RepID=I0JVG7_METFB|nr:LLM class flavin-dependent oxidoreductase [Candidatus Methylacidiphilum fumarolicum]CCG91236.1 Luciferase-like, subgroup [Methylacidiphilum fumariolicum SolV]MBW6414861.1 LLM class flavin-dependent oxidoreductase [Candidatus Methylacidiphilum fumarolicum]TFE68301.1 luciferase [Candidatus Methylacidiphilum fumarolicum]TFE76556.1 luciferase [Candidatus Methylacidiphilum fumarolicum]CAI9084564.1 Luciferase-like, subgroup [Candidatus Methylacidiphilum fumarolicum]
MEIGLSGCGGGLESEGEVRDWLVLAEEVESLGFSSLWINEEHFQSRAHTGAARNCVDPMVLAGALAAKTSRLRIGFSALLLPLHHPIRMAEAIATLDRISGGRIDFGISRGGNQRYFDAFGVDPARADEAFITSLRQILDCWREEPLSLGANSYCILPKPVQRPHPPIYIATYHKERARWAAEQGFYLIQHGIQSPTHLATILSAYRSGGGRPEQVPVGRFLYVSNDDRSAYRELFPVIEELTAFLRKIGITKRGVLTEEELIPERFYQEIVIAGGPATCAEHLRSMRELYGIRRVNGLCSFFGFLPRDLLFRSLTLIAREVLPLLREDSSTGNVATIPGVSYAE